jgi:hypothetical protein
VELLGETMAYSYSNPDTHATSLAASDILNLSGNTFTYEFSILHKSSCVSGAHELRVITITLGISPVISAFLPRLLPIYSQVIVSCLFVS